MDVAHLGYNADHILDENEDSDYKQSISSPAQAQSKADKEPELIGSDPYEKYKDNIITSKEEIKQTFKQEQKTILDEPLGSVMNNTLSFMTYSGDTYLKKLYEAETIMDLEGKDASDLTWMQTASKYSLALALFCRDSDNAIYLGILLIFVSLIIYFLSIVSPTNGLNIANIANSP